MSLEQSKVEKIHQASHTLVCDDCGKRGDDVEDTICPYEYEINDKSVDAILCGECHQVRWEET